MTGIAKLETALRRAAELVAMDKVYGPIFERIDAELTAARAQSSEDVIQQARAILNT